MEAASVFVMLLDKAHTHIKTQPMQRHINVGFGLDITIPELANIVSSAIGYVGNITLDPSKPDGAPRKWMDSSKLNQLGWRPAVTLEEGLVLAYANFLKQL